MHMRKENLSWIQRDTLPQMMSAESVRAKGLKFENETGKKISHKKGKKKNKTPRVSINPFFL